VKPFEHLHPALQHHIVNSLGWRMLRPLQEQSIEPILSGQHAILLAPTAGGKTEAAIFPVLSRMLSENWSGLSVLYLCPIRALLNNLHTRLSHYSNLVGRDCAIWHGDIGRTDKRQFVRQVTDCLLTTPESLEVMLISKQLDRQSLFKDLRVVIVDEIHSFAGDDRGWHLLAILERLTKIAGRELQRIGLSATVGNPGGLLHWLSGHCQGSGVVVEPEGKATGDSDVQIDFVGSVENAALVISRLHRGEKRLVFTDSRSQAEQVSARLRKLGVNTFVSHSSLSAEERRQAEEAFSAGSDCVIVATSTLELGVDVGDLDRVIQIDAPSSVAAFLQRMGRTGRRAGTNRNFLFVATSRAALLKAAALVELWKTGYVEPVQPPPAPFHLMAQQLMALALQEGGIGRFTWWDWVGRMPAFAAFNDADKASVVAYMLDSGILADDQGILWLGRAGEDEFGRKNFMEIFSVFRTPPLFSVRHGQTDLGEVHESSFLVRSGEKPVLLLAGRGWVTTSIDWVKKIAYVEPSDQIGRSRWIGSGQPLSFAYCQAIKRVLQLNEQDLGLSRRATSEMDGAREEYAWLSPECTTLVLDSSGDRCYWWTFGGLRANAMLASNLSGILPSGFDNLCLRFDRRLDPRLLEEALEAARSNPPQLAPISDSDRVIDELKFSVCVPRALAKFMLGVRLSDPDAVARLVNQALRVVHTLDAV
jgi:ATP-dependent helicase Lhr and Lhr-like helicase